MIENNKKIENLTEEDKLRLKEEAIKNINNMLKLQRDKLMEPPICEINYLDYIYPKKDI